jgi:hypothetical protein
MVFLLRLDEYSVLRVEPERTISLLLSLNDGTVRSAMPVSMESLSGMRAFCWGNPEARSATGRRSVKTKML